MTSSYTSRVADLPFPLKFLVTHDTNKFLRTSTKDFEKISYILSRFALGQLLGPLDTADQPFLL